MIKEVQNFNGFYRYGKDIPVQHDSSIKTKIKKFDDFLSKVGGFVRSSSILLTGTSGAGKTTLSVFVQALLKDVRTVIYSREMYASDVQSQCAEYDIYHSNAFIADVESCPSFSLFMENVKQLAPEVIVVDSLQAIAKQDFPDIEEDKAIDAMMHELRAYCHETGSAVIFISHVNRKNTFTGKNTKLQMIDGHLQMIYDPKNNERTISWAGKNRKGKDPRASMFYTFGDGEIKFYTPEEWEIMHQGKTLEEVMEEAMVYYLKGLKEHENWPSIRKEILKNETKIKSRNIDRFDLLLANLSKVKEQLNKYGI
jgi:predicted ATP-dependent serine protease